MTVHNFEHKNSILNTFVTQLRDITVHTDKMRFRKNIERIGEILAYELSKTLDYQPIEVKTPLGIKKTHTLTNDIVLCSILRAGLPLHNGLLNYFDTAENAFISAYRHHPDNKEQFEIVVEYFASPSVKDKTLILADPMLATGKSLLAVYEAIKQHGAPKELHIVSVIGSKKGIETIKNQLPENTHLWIAAVDDELNSKGYIVPGLGDAGDLAYGTKL